MKESPPSAAVRATALRKSFGSGAARTEVLRGLDLTLAPGAFEAVMGASGSGKSTLLHLLAGLLAPDSGRVEIGGADLTAMSDAAATSASSSRASTSSRRSTSRRTSRSPSASTAAARTPRASQRSSPVSASPERSGAAPRSSPAASASASPSPARSSRSRT